MSSSKVLAPAKFFSNLNPAIMGTDPLRGMVVPSDKTLVVSGELPLTYLHSLLLSLFIPIPYSPLLHTYW
jgi:hypothetical protein